MDIIAEQLSLYVAVLVAADIESLLLIKCRGEPGNEATPVQT